MPMVCFDTPLFAVWQRRLCRLRTIRLRWGMFMVFARRYETDNAIVQAREDRRIWHALSSLFCFFLCLVTREWGSRRRTWSPQVILSFENQAALRVGSERFDCCPYRFLFCWKQDALPVRIACPRCWTNVKYHTVPVKDPSHSTLANYS